MSAKTKRVCVDVGGTFTDCLVMDETGLLQKFKSSTTPSDPSKGFMDAMKKAARHYSVGVNEFIGQIEVLVHGTTLATNILLTGRGARAGMLTTKNFRDIIELRRAMKPQDVSLYNLFIPPARPLIPRSERIGIEERTLYSGEVMTPLNEQEVADAVRQLKAQGVEFNRGVLPALVCQYYQRAPRGRDLRRDRAGHLRYYLTRDAAGVARV